LGATSPLIAKSLEFELAKGPLGALETIGNELISVENSGIRLRYVLQWLRHGDVRRIGSAVGDLNPQVTWATGINWDIRDPRVDRVWQAVHGNVDVEVI
jgi:hypothetical protein